MNFKQAISFALVTPFAISLAGCSNTAYPVLLKEENRIISQAHTGSEINELLQVYLIAEDKCVEYNKALAGFDAESEIAKYKITRRSVDCARY